MSGTNETSNEEKVTFRLFRSLRETLNTDVALINKKERGNKISLDDYILEMRNVFHSDAKNIKKLQHKSLTRDDMEQLFYKHYIKKNESISMEEFKEKMHNGELVKFIKNECKHIHSIHC